MLTKQFRQFEQWADENDKRKAAATIMKKYEKNGMIGIHLKGTPAPKEEYFIAKKIYKEIVKNQK